MESIMNDRILNFTQHKATLNQAVGGLFEPDNKDQIKNLLTLIGIKNAVQLTSLIRERVDKLTRIAIDSGFNKVLIGGHPGLTSALAIELKKNNIEPVMAHSDRMYLKDEAGIKTFKFEHTFFYNV